MESALVVHIEAITPKSCEEPEHPTKSRDGRRTGGCRFVSTYRGLNLRQTFGYIPAGRDVDEHRTHEIAHCRPATWTATGDRHGDGNRID